MTHFFLFEAGNEAFIEDTFLQFKQTHLQSHNFLSTLSQGHERYQLHVNRSE